jgi:hypothetical protein
VVSGSIRAIDVKAPLPEGSHQIEFRAVDQLGGAKVTREGNYTVFIK